MPDGNLRPSQERDKFCCPIASVKLSQRIRKASQHRTILLSRSGSRSCANHRRPRLRPAEAAVIGASHSATQAAFPCRKSARPLADSGRPLNGLQCLTWPGWIACVVACGVRILSVFHSCSPPFAIRGVPVRITGWYLPFSSVESFSRRQTPGITAPGKWSRFPARATPPRCPIPLLNEEKTLPSLSGRDFFRLTASPILGGVSLANC